MVCWSILRIYTIYSQISAILRVGTIEDFNREDVCKIDTYCRNTINRNKIQIKYSILRILTGRMCVKFILIVEIQ